MGDATGVAEGGGGERKSLCDNDSLTIKKRKNHDLINILHVLGSPLAGYNHG